MGRLTGKRVLVTGASRGIGAAIARAVAGESARVALLARGSTELKELAVELGAVAVPADLTDAAVATAAVESAAAQLGGLDVVVNNAGVFPLGGIRDGDPADWRTMLETNIWALLTVTRAAVPLLTAGEHPQIVNIGSVAGRRVAFGIQTVYAATKHALEAITEGLRKELSADGVRVTVIAPSLVRTGGGQVIRDPGLRASMTAAQDAVGLAPEAVADQVVHVLAAPPDVHVCEIVLRSSRERD
jgi:NADP-dependent 3-hydroxy acid dehydrogenase YdfG